MPRNFMDFLWTRRKMLGPCCTWGSPEEGTTHQGAPGGPGAPWWVVPTTGAPRTASLLYKYPKNPRTLGESMKYVGECINFKNFLRTRKIMVMHSNKREECCPRTLVDRKRKHYNNAVDVVVCLHDQPILAPKVRHLRDLHTFSSVTSHELMIQ